MDKGGRGGNAYPQNVDKNKCFFFKHFLNQLMNHKPVYGTAPDTPGLVRVNDFFFMVCYEIGVMSSG